jgi:REP element-mobilizing transposase RayT
MPYNPEIHHRRSIRMQGYDYSQAGLYFVTICVQNRECLFGNVSDGEMILNDVGQMIEKWRVELSNKFSDIELDEYVIMPNHFHAIVMNTGDGHVGAHLRVRPDLRVRPNDKNGEHIEGEHTGSPLHVRPDNHNMRPNDKNGEHIKGEHTGSPLHVRPDNHNMRPNDKNGEHIEGEHTGSPLHAVVQWFKTMTTNEYIRGVKTLNWQPFDKKLWQRNYYEHIVRDTDHYARIAGYIISNPAKWSDNTLLQ